MKKYQVRTEGPMSDYPESELFDTYEEAQAFADKLKAESGYSEEQMESIEKHFRRYIQIYNI